MSKTDRKQDVFANIAAQQSAAHREQLIESQPPALPERNLPAGRSNPRAAFTPAAKLDTPQKLQRALERERRRMAPFLRDLAPAVASARIVKSITGCDWRMETETDRLDFNATLSGAGEWDRVDIPHYGGPVGRATAYYRTTFRINRAMLDKGSVWVCLKGVDYKAHVFVNGAFLGSHEGFFAPFEFDFTAHARLGENVLVVKVENDAAPISDGGSWGMTVDGDKLYAATGPGWDDPELGWHHCPPGMGIYQAVTIEARPQVHLADLFVRPLPEEKKAELWIEVFNCGTEPQGVRFQVSVFGQNFKAVLFRDRVFEPPQKGGPRVSRFRLAFDVPKPRLWDLDTPWLYQVQVRLDNGDGMARQFGMRSFRMDESEKPYGRYHLNGREIRLRGANTMGFEQQDVMRGDFDQLRDDILLARLCNMNFWRLTQRPVQPEVYEMCDKLGFLTQSDLPLFGCLPRRQFCEAVRQAEEMERLVRNHPCNIVVSYINEPFPPAWGDKTHRQCDRAELERFFEAASHAVRLANPDRVIKPVDGDYDPPAEGLPDNHCYCCWYNGHGVDIGRLHKGWWQWVKPGWHYGCGEFGTEGLDPVDVMRKYYPKDWLPPTDDQPSDWSPDSIVEAQTGRFHYMWFETQHTLNDWVRAGQEHQAWATRVMTEAFRRDSRMNSCAIHLFIDAFPAGWMKAIMDVDRQPKPAYFAYREALTPLMANLRTDRYAFFAGETIELEAWLCNDGTGTPKGAMLHYQVEVGGVVVFAQKSKADVPSCSSSFQGFVRYTAPAVDERATMLVRLALLDAKGEILHDTAVCLEVFPKSATLEGRAHIVGTTRGKAARLARAVGLKPFYSGRVGPSDVIVIDDVARYKRARRKIDAAVEAGATAVFLELPVGEHQIAGDEIEIEAAGMGARHVVNRDTGHPIVEGVCPSDFKFWYDDDAGIVTPFLHSTFRADGWTPILLTGNGNWRGDWSPALAAAEKKVGAGRVRIAQIQLANRVKGNPVGNGFAGRLLQRH